jgi:hypothetical protein
MTKSTAGTSITRVLQEKRSFPPAREFSRQAHIKSVAEYDKLWTEAKDKPEESLEDLTVLWKLREEEEKDRSVRSTSRT